MKKFSLFLSFLLAFALTAKAQNSEGSQESNVVLVEDAAEELTDGTVIALQSRDYSAGAGYYFAGARQKTSTFSVNNLFVVEGNAKEGMKLRRFPNGKYIGRNSTTVTEVESAGSAATFTAISKGKSTAAQFPYGDSTPMDNTDDNLYVRFTTTGTHLNTRNLGEAPQYGGGTQGYSVWYVYKFPEYTLNIEQVSQASLSFYRAGTTAGNVTVSVNLFDGDDGDDGQNNVNVKFETGSYWNNELQNQELKNNNNFSGLSDILCPNINIGNNGNSNPYAILKFTISGLEDFNFNKVLLQMKPYDNNGNYLGGGRNCNVDLICGEGEEAWSTLTNINFSPIVDWQMTGETVTADSEGNFVLTLKITRTTEGAGSGFCFGLYGITLIDEERESKEVSEESEMITDMKIADVKDLLKAIKSGYGKLNDDIESDYEQLAYKFPVLAAGVTNVVWPSTLNNVFNGLDSNFELLTHAEGAIKEKNTENLDAAKQNLADFIRICNKNYPISVAYTATANYGTLYTPFAVASGQLPEGLAFFQCTGCEDGVITLDDGSQTLDANTAYIVKTIGNADVNTVQLIGFSGMSNIQANDGGLLKGTHKKIRLDEGNYYVLQNQDGYGLGFYKVGNGGKEVPAGKCYLDLSGEMAQGLQFLRFPDGTLTAIDAIDAAEPANAATYDLSGRRVTTTTTRGLYIMGGRKVLVK